MSQKSFIYTTWSLFAVSIILPVLAWGSRLDWELSSLSKYQIFPLLGMLAWMTMWGHFVTAAIRIKISELQKPSGYSVITGWLVLICLLLHPGILAYAQARNGAGLPLQSYIDYTGKKLAVAVYAGVAALLIFLSFEFFNRMKNNKTIKKYWWAVSVSQSLAMILIFIHALRLGPDIMSGWFRVVWFIYGIVLLPCFYIIHTKDFSKHS